MPVFVCGCTEGIAAAVGGAQVRAQVPARDLPADAQVPARDLPAEVPADVPADAQIAYWFETVPRVADFHYHKWPKGIDTYVCMDCSARWHKSSSKTTTAGSGEISAVGSVELVDDPAAANMNMEPLQTWEVRRQCILYSKKSKAFWCKACRVQWVLCE